MARRYSSNRNFSQQNRKPKHNWSNEGGKLKNMLDMRREKGFNFELKNMLEGFQLGDNKGIIAATITSKAGRNSIDDAMEYVNRLKTTETLDDNKVKMVRTLLKKYSKWR